MIWAPWFTAGSVKVNKVPFIKINRSWLPTAKQGLGMTRITLCSRKNGICKVGNNRWPFLPENTKKKPTVPLKSPITPLNLNVDIPQNSYNLKRNRKENHFFSQLPSSSVCIKVFSHRCSITSLWAPPTQDASHKSGQFNINP